MTKPTQLNHRSRGRPEPPIARRPSIAGPATNIDTIAASSSSAGSVADSVATHELWGGGSYIFTNVDPTIHAAHGFEVPVVSGVRLHHVMTVNLSAGTIDHVVNDTGAPVDNSNTGQPSFTPEFP